MPDNTNTYAPGTAVSFLCNGLSISGTVLDTSRLRRRNGSPLVAGYLVVQRSDDQGWTAVDDDGTRLESCWYIRSTEVTRVVPLDPQVAVEKALADNAKAIDSVRAFRAATGQNRAFMAYLRACQNAQSALQDLNALVIANL